MVLLLMILLLMVLQYQWDTIGKDTVAKGTVARDTSSDVVRDLMCSKICSSSVCTILATSATSLRSPAYRLSLESTVEGWKIPDIQEFKKPLNQHPPLAAMHTNPHLSQASRSHSRADKGRLALEINIFRSNLIDISTKNSSYDVIGQPTGSLSTTDNEQPHFEISFFTGLQEVLIKLS